VVTGGPSPARTSKPVPPPPATDISQPAPSGQLLRNEAVTSNPCLDVTTNYFGVWSLAMSDCASANARWTVLGGQFMSVGAIGQCLAAIGFPFPTIELASCSSDPSQQFTEQGQGNGVVLIHPASDSAECVAYDTSPGGPTAGSVIATNCSGTPNERWHTR
jgi:hypothetical protein